MFNRETGKHEIKKVIKSTGQTITGVGDTKEEARKDLYAKLEANHRVPGSNVPGYRGQKWHGQFKVVGYANSPGFQYVQGEDGKTSYEFKADRKAQILAPVASETVAGPAIASEPKTEG